jgi:hypothetical protein
MDGWINAKGVQTYKDDEIRKRKKRSKNRNRRRNKKKVFQCPKREW